MKDQEAHAQRLQTKLAELGLHLVVQKAEEIRDKNNERTLDPTNPKEKTMNTSSESVAHTENHPTVDVVAKSTSNTADHTQALLTEFRRQNAPATQAIKLGVAAVAGFVVVTGAVLTASAIINRDKGEMPIALPGKK